MKKIILVAGARPNFMKIAPIIRELKAQSSKFEAKKNLAYVLVHTGQHYDYEMSQAFFEELGIPKPDYYLGVGSDSHAVQTANIMVKFEAVCLKEMPDMVVVVGDVNSTIAAGLVAKKLHIKLAHVEAGLRSRDRQMPEEINRLATDAITDLFFTTEDDGTQNLLAEGHAKDSVCFVGHVMIDNLFYQLGKIGDADAVSLSVRSLKECLPEKYLCMTLHRPSNVDDSRVLTRLMETVNEIAKGVPIIFPCHPRTRSRIEEFGLGDLFIEKGAALAPVSNGIVMMDPLNYNDFLYLWKDCAVMLTDSGGLQEETTALGVPCLTLRQNTERPVTVEVGTNILIGNDMGKLRLEVNKVLNGKKKNGRIPDLWDGKASERIVGHILRYLEESSS